MKGLLKKMAMAMLLAFGLSAPVYAEEACEYNTAMEMVDTLFAYNPTLEIMETLSVEVAEDAELIQALADVYNETPPVTVTIDMDELFQVLIFDKPEAPTVYVMFVGRECYLASMPLPKGPDGSMLPI